MLVSIAIATHNEGDLLWKTVQSCYESSDDVDLEIIVADDVSTDDSVQQVRSRFPDVIIHEQTERRGVAATKDLAAKKSRGDVLLFLDGHCKPLPGAVRQLAEDVQHTDGQAIITPAIPALDVATWENQMHQIGHGYILDLETFESRFIGLNDMKEHPIADGRTLYESPCLIGCCMAIAPDLYKKLWGFDIDMLIWGTEDVDLAVKSWLMGHPILHDAQAMIGHRFQSSFDHYTVEWEHVFVNQMRMVHKCYSDAHKQQWQEKFRQRHENTSWDHIVELFEKGKESADRERQYLLDHRKHDEMWYVERFGLNWPEPAPA